MPTSHLQLRRLYCRLNRRYFASKLPNIPVIWAPCDDAHGVVTFSGNDPIKLEMDTTLMDTTRVTEIVMLHEMCHIKLCSIEHGKVFKQEIRRLVSLGAYDKLL